MLHKTHAGNKVIGNLPSLAQGKTFATFLKKTFQ